MKTKKSTEFYDILPVSLIDILNTLNISYESYIVGGSCRNFLIKYKIKDYDITTNATPEEVKKLFENKYKIIDTGILYGTITIVTIEGNYEITTFRSESYTNMDRKPSTVVYEKNVINDLERRDFTVNALIYDIKTKTFIDYFDGLKCIRQKILKSIISPAESYRRDPLRILRLIRFACTLDFDIEKKEIDFIQNNCALLLNISQERITEEFNRILISKNVTDGLYLLYETHILDLILPEIILMKRFRQNNPYHYDYEDGTLTLWDHVIKVLYGCAINNKLEVRLAALFHDIGKPYCFQVISNNYWRYAGHPEKSAEMTADIMKRMKYSNKQIEDVTKLVLYHDIPFTVDYVINKKLVKKILNIFDNNINDINNWGRLKEADILAHNNYRDIKEKFYIAIRDFPKVVKEIQDKVECFSLKDLKVNGNDIVDLGFKGIIIGIILDQLLEEVIEERLENDKTKLIEFIPTKFNLPIRGENNV